MKQGTLAFGRAVYEFMHTEDFNFTSFHWEYYVDM